MAPTLAKRPNSRDGTAVNRGPIRDCEIPSILLVILNDALSPPQVIENKTQAHNFLPVLHDFKLTRYISKGLFEDFMYCVNLA
jgi:hypothetical protein